MVYLFKCLSLITISFFSLSVHANVCDRSHLIIRYLENNFKKTCDQINETDLSKIEQIYLSSYSLGLEPSELNWDHLKTTDFKGFNSATTFFLDGGRLTAPTSKLFYNLPNLKNLIIHWVHGIYSLPENLFNHTPNIETFYISTDDHGSGQNFKLTKFPKRLFQKQPTLRKITFMNTPLKSIPEDAFSGSPELEVIDFSGQDELKELPAYICRDCPSMHSINFSFTSIEKIPYSAFLGMPKLRYVSLYYTGNVPEIDKKTLIAAYPNVRLIFEP